MTEAPDHSQLAARLQRFIKDDAAADTLRQSTIERTREALEVIDQAFDRYGFHKLAISYNGGKDCLVLLVLYVAYLASNQAKSRAAGGRPNPASLVPTVYVSIKDPFKEVDDFVDESARIYGLSIEHIKLPMKEAFASYLDSHSQVEAILVGTRRNDPHGANLKFFDPTDQGWPSFMRVHPIIDWNYAQIWDFLLAMEVPYCILYDLGYTSLGGQSDTLPNPSLAIDAPAVQLAGSGENGESTVRYRPAWALVDGAEERMGRERARISQPDSVAKYNTTRSRSGEPYPRSPEHPLTHVAEPQTKAEPSRSLDTESLPGDESTVLVTYASQTGTAEDIARTTYDRLRRTTTAMDIQLCDIAGLALEDLLDVDRLVICVATSGQGEMPASLRQGFWAMLTDARLPDDLFEEITVDLAMLGDTKYPRFNFAGKKLKRRLLQLGAHVRHECVLDESQTEYSDAQLAAWLEKVAPGTPRRGRLPPLHTISPAPNATPASLKLPATVKSTERIARRICKLALDVGEQAEPGDVLVVLPSNTDEAVDMCLSLLRLDDCADEPLEVCGLSSLHETRLGGSITTLRLLVKHVLPLNDVPRRSLFASLIDFTTDEDYREKFVEWTTDADDYYDYATRPRRTLLEALADFSNGLDIPREYVLELFGEVAPREYSIAGEAAPGTTELLVSLISYTTIMKKQRQGTASRWIASLVPGDHIYAFIRRNPMPLPSTGDQVLMIGPGTGLAPLRFLYQRTNQGTIIHGSRSADDDLRLFSQLPGWTSYSRADRHLYVQRFMLDDSECRAAIQRILQKNSNARIYLAGSSGDMPARVRESLDAIGGVGTVKALEEGDRWWEETWG
ncbi:3'-phosphoadenosine 5'-phosphosulfate sulfotransferase [Savitreella phatthalungensis]